MKTEFFLTIDSISMAPSSRRDLHFSERKSVMVYWDSRQRNVAVWLKARYWTIDWPGTALSVSAYELT
jgi:hypothetical protein